MTNIITPDSELVTKFIASVGDVVKICRPLGYPYKPSKTSWDPDSEIEDEEENKSASKLYGFEILNTNLGEFVNYSNVTENTECVYYQHNKSGKQIIKYSAKGVIIPTTFYIMVEGIVVHDHASIYQGGPAYATYYSETPRQEGE